MVNLVLGIFIGLFGTWLFHISKSTKRITWFAWMLFVVGAVLVVLGLNILTGSIIEHETQAGWMGFGISIFMCIILVALGWFTGVREKVGKTD
jgi:hypothetical protein